MRACTSERIRREETAQPIDVARIHRGHGVVESRVRTEGRHRIGEFDMLFELRPAVEAILARDHQLRVGERQRRVEDGLGRLPLESGMVRGDASCRRRPAVAVFLVELSGLELELTKVGTRRQGSGRHTRSFRKRPMSAHGPKEAVIRCESNSKVGLGPFPRTGGALRARLEK